MRPRFRLLLTAALLSLLLIGSFGTRAHAFTNGQSASLVIGQKDFTSSVTETSQSGLAFALQVIFDSTGNMWVTDYDNNRVLEFKPPFSTDMRASLVIGQGDFTSSTPATSQEGLNGPWGLSFDRGGNLWIVDERNNRVVAFRPPFSNGMTAAMVIGQKDFTHASSGVSNDSLLGPNADVVDHLGNLWVFDSGHGRILEFVQPFENGMNASLTLSVPLTHESELAFDPSGNLWVGDTGNNRIFGFKPPFSFGMNASWIIGQPTPTSSKPSNGRTGLNFTGGTPAVAFDSAGDLWVSDYANNRVLEFSPPFSSGMAASVVVGQQDFTSTSPATTQNGLSGPLVLGFDPSGNLWVPDYGNSRILEFTSTPVPEFPTASLAIVALVTLAVVVLVSRRFLSVRPSIR